MKTTGEVYEQMQRLFRRLMERGRRFAKQAHPETGGLDLMVHNWGNPAAKAVWADTWRWVQRMNDSGEVLYAAAEHRQHAARGKCPHWCRHRGY